MGVVMRLSLDLLWLTTWMSTNLILNLFLLFLVQYLCALTLAHVHLALPLACQLVKANAVHLALAALAQRLALVSKTVHQSCSSTSVPTGSNTMAMVVKSTSVHLSILITLLLVMEVMDFVALLMAQWNSLVIMICPLKWNAKSLPSISCGNCNSTTWQTKVFARTCRI